MSGDGWDWTVGLAQIYKEAYADVNNAVSLVIKHGYDVIGRIFEHRTITKTSESIPKKTEHDGTTSDGNMAFVAPGGPELRPPIESVRR